MTKDEAQMITDMSKQKAIADKLNQITRNSIAIESLQESIDDYKRDLVELYKDAGYSKNLTSVTQIVEVYINEEKVRKAEEVKIEKANSKLEKTKEIKEELSMFDRFKPVDIYEEADLILGG